MTLLWNVDKQIFYTVVSSVIFVAIRFFSMLKRKEKFSKSKTSKNVKITQASA